MLVFSTSRYFVLFYLANLSLIEKVKRCMFQTIKMFPLERFAFVEPIYFFTSINLFQLYDLLEQRKRECPKKPR